jgi:hypothetical protein
MDAPAHLARRLQPAEQLLLQQPFALALGPPSRRLLCAPPAGRLRGVDQGQGHAQQQQA